jgi:hypothetical protein
MTRLFISYAYQDEDSAMKVLQALKQYGFKTWAEAQDVEADHDWYEAVEQAMSAADACVLLLSTAALQLPSVAREYHYFMKAGKPLYAVKMQHIEYDEMPPALVASMPVDLTQDFKRGIKKLVKRVHERETPTAMLRDKGERGSRPGNMRLSVTVNGKLTQADTALLEFVERLQKAGIEVEDVAIVDLQAKTQR